ncbi:antibiotic biosynthesis monooxygenase [Saccharopolyspora sp. NPDC000359]|uniref:antibiotic biosynthesis monooxygenase n=1 Tax=Saccharopolyspora sp. NPDC000359 TaxID=3154251 RepID=UPI003327B4A9
MNDLPDITRADAGLVLVGEWSEAPERQLAAARAAADVANQPTGLLSHTVLVGTDGSTLLHYSQWSDQASCEEHLRTAPDDRTARAVAFHRYRSLVLSQDRPGCVVAVRFRSDSHDTARRFVDTLLDEEPGFARRTDVAPPAGMISNHFHISTDGTRVVNYAEFVDEAAHRAVVANNLQADHDVPQLIGSTPGLELIGFKRFTTWLSR